MKVYLSIPDLSYFLFPEAKRIKTYGFMSSSDLVLYDLKPHDKILAIEQGIKECYSNYIITTSVQSHAVDTTLDSKIDYVNFIASYRGLRVAKDIETKIEKLSDDDFKQFIKMSLALRRWYREIFSSHEKIYHLYEAMLKSTKDFVTLYLEISSYMSTSEIFSSVITFLLRLKNREDQKETLSEYYRKLTKIASIQHSGVEGKLLEFIKLPNTIPVDNKYLGFFLSLK